MAQKYKLVSEPFSNYEDVQVQKDKVLYQNIPDDVKVLLYQDLLRQVLARKQAKESKPVPVRIVMEPSSQSPSAPISNVAHLDETATSPEIRTTRKRMRIQETIFPEYVPQATPIPRKIRQRRAKKADSGPALRTQMTFRSRENIKPRWESFRE